MANGTCSIPSCGKTGVLTRTWCVNHYARYRRWGDPLGAKPPRQEVCELPGCTRGGRFWNGLCNTHAKRVQATGDPQAHIPIKEPPGITECSVPGCGLGGLIRRGWCTLHYQRWQRHGDPHWEPVKAPETCTAEGCDGRHAARGWCATHYMRWVRTGSIELPSRPELACVIEGCSKPRHGWDWCEKHYWRWKRNGDPLALQHERNDSPPETCTLDGCVQPHFAKGRCLRHYTQLKYLRDRDAINARHAQHYRDNPEMYAVKTIARSRVLADVAMDATDRLLSAEYRKAIKNDPCAYCGAPGQETDHVFPLSLGGTEHWWNLARSCRWCNRSKAAHCGTWFILKRGTVDEPGLAAAIA